MMIVMLLMDNGHFACDFEEIFFLHNEQKTNFQRKQLPNSAAVAEYASKPHVVVKLQSQVFSSFHLRSMIFGSTYGRNYSKTSDIYTKLTDKMVAAEQGEHYRTGTTTTSVLDLASTAPPSSTATGSGTGRTRRTTPPSPCPSPRVSHQAMTRLRSVLSSVRAVDNVIQLC